MVKPSYENWAPWIGKQTRKSDSVFNTEYKKITQDQTEADLSEAAEDRLFDILLQQQVLLLLYRTGTGSEAFTPGGGAGRHGKSCIS